MAAAPKSTRQASHARGGKSSGGRKPAQKTDQSIARSFWGLFLIGLGILMLACLVMEPEKPLIKFVRELQQGLAGFLCLMLPFYVCWVGGTLAFLPFNPAHAKRIVAVFALLLLVATCAQLFQIQVILDVAVPSKRPENYTQFLSATFEQSSAIAAGGGLLGALLSWPLHDMLDVWGSMVVLVVFIILDLVVLTGVSMNEMGDTVSQKWRHMREDMEVRRSEREERRAEREEAYALEQLRMQQVNVRPEPKMTGLEEEQDPPWGTQWPKPSRGQPPTSRIVPDPEFVKQKPKKQRGSKAAREEAEYLDAYPFAEEQPGGLFDTDPARAYAMADDGQGAAQARGQAGGPYAEVAASQDQASPVRPRDSASGRAKARPKVSKAHPFQVFSVDASDSGEDAHPGGAAQGRTQFGTAPFQPVALRDDALSAPGASGERDTPEPWGPVRASSGRREGWQDPPPVLEFPNAKGDRANQPAQRPIAARGGPSMYIETLEPSNSGQVKYGETPDVPTFQASGKRAETNNARASRVEPSDEFPWDEEPWEEEVWQAGPEREPDSEPWIEEEAQSEDSAGTGTPTLPRTPPARRVQDLRTPADRRLDQTPITLPAEQNETPAAPQLPYRYPPFHLLNSPKRLAAVDTRKLDEFNAAKLIETLHSFGIQARVLNVTHGPAITRYELQPAPGVKVSRIVSLVDDIALNMAAAGVRIEAPIPGKAAVGIEIPNESISTVVLREVLESDEAQTQPSALACALGKDIAGRRVVADLAKMPHVLIAGATGSGKSVCINTLISSLIFRSSPEQVRMILIDPKVVELSVYNGIPHLLAPVVTDPKKASGALSWAVAEMERRYREFAIHGVRDIKGFNATLRDGETAMPQIVVIIDELADLMMVAPGEVEESICRLAQLARAAGIHLVIATQRPSVNVITGVIKANIPSRIAFAVSSQVDSRTILDSAGAEKLLGKGDMLYAPQGSGKPVRVQGCFVSDDEVARVVEFVKNNRAAEYDEEVVEHLNNLEDGASDSTNNDTESVVDDLLPQAIEIALETGQASISMLQRRLRVGYARAGRIIDEMARRGIISQAEGAKPREVLMSREEYRRLFEME